MKSRRVLTAVYLQSTAGDPVDTTGLTLSVNGTTAGSWSTPPKTTLLDVSVTAGDLPPIEVADVLLLVKYLVT